MSTGFNYEIYEIPTKWVKSREQKEIENYETIF